MTEEQMIAIEVRAATSNEDIDEQLELIAEVRRLRKLCDELWWKNETQKRTLTGEHVAQLHVALATYGRHSAGCRVFRTTKHLSSTGMILPDPGPCNCGLDAALEPTYEASVVPERKK